MSDPIAPTTLPPSGQPSPPLPPTEQSTPRRPTQMIPIPSCTGSPLAGASTPQAEVIASGSGMKMNALGVEGFQSAGVGEVAGEEGGRNSYDAVDDDDYEAASEDEDDDNQPHDTSSSPSRRPSCSTTASSSSAHTPYSTRSSLSSIATSISSATVELPEFIDEAEEGEGDGEGGSEGEMEWYAYRNGVEGAGAKYRRRKKGLAGGGAGGVEIVGVDREPEGDPLPAAADGQLPNTSLGIENGMAALNLDHRSNKLGLSPGRDGNISAIGSGSGSASTPASSEVDYESVDSLGYVWDEGEPYEDEDGVEDGGEGEEEGEGQGYEEDPIYRYTLAVYEHTKRLYLAARINHEQLELARAKDRRNGGSTYTGRGRKSGIERMGAKIRTVAATRYPGSLSD